MNSFNIPDSSRIWLFLANQPLTESQLHELEKKLDEFTASWQTHGNPLTAQYIIEYCQLVIIAVDESKTPPSGCSIDKAFRLLTEFQDIHHLDFFQRTLLGIPISAESLQVLPSTEIISAVKEGILSAETTVVNTFAQTLAEYLSLPIIPLNSTWLSAKLN